MIFNKLTLMFETTSILFSKIFEDLKISLKDFIKSFCTNFYLNRKKNIENLYFMFRYGFKY
jgi:hypothetical protein